MREESGWLLLVADELSFGRSLGVVVTLAAALGSQMKVVPDVLVTESDLKHVALTPSVPILVAPKQGMTVTVRAAMAAEIVVFGVPHYGHEGDDYVAFRNIVRHLEAATLQYSGIALGGSPRILHKLTAGFAVFADQ